MWKRKDKVPPPLTVRYESKPTDGSPDQLLTVENNTDESIIPTFSFIAHDPYGRPMPHITTRTVHGSDHGVPVLPGRGILREFLRFEGEGARQVRFVSPQLVEAQPNDHPALEAPVRTVMIDMAQKATADPEDFWGIGFTNPNPFGVQVRVSLLAFAPRQGDHPSQVEDAVTLTEDVDLASVSNHVIWLPEDVRGQFQAVEHHLVPQTLI